jgi:hypothetical protein
MKLTDRLFLLGVGIAIWVLGTLWYRLRGTVLLETASLRYWINFILTPVASAVLCIAILKLRHVSAPNWAAAMLLIALPGMFGEALLLSNFGAFMPTLRLETSGRFGAMLFAAYAFVLAIGEAVTLCSQ